MAYEFRLPDIGEGVAEGEVVKWFVEEGGTVAEDAPLVSVLTDKANVEIPSPKAGRIAKIHAKEGEKVKVGGLLVTIETGGPSGPAPPHQSGTDPAPTVPKAATPPPSAAGTTSEGPSSPTSARVLASPFVRRMAAERGLDLTTIRGTGPGGRIQESDLGQSATAAVAPVSSDQKAMGAADPGPAAPAPSESVGPAPANSTPGTASGEYERVPIRGIRRVIFEHMAVATHTAAHFTYVEEVDATELVRWRERMAKHVEKSGVKLSYLPLILKAVVAGLRAHPWMNARMDDEHQELHVYREVHVGIATAAPEGLIVPVIRNVEQKSIAKLAKEIQDLAERGRSGKLSRAELTGGAFTITSLGALGGVLATPILNYPEVGILGVHRIVKRPVYMADGTLVPAHLMNLSVSLDHRVLDGIVGAQFLQVVKSYLEDPHQLFAELA
jgi:pyruvate dehydrogenase E2 component (dihydrolipoamide acetyltransferase)